MALDVKSFVELHARASRIEIELEERDGGLLIAIVDDGRGGEWRHPDWSRSVSDSR
jgi:signal transduction histidine kinase